MGNDISVGKNGDLESMRKYMDFSPGQIEIIREKFDLMADENLTISKEQFGKLMKIQAKEIDRIFEYFDSDSSGKLDSYEFISALVLLASASLKKKAELIFNLYDFDRNKTITQNELVICMKTTMSALNSMCGKEEATIEQAELKTREILRKYDTNKDGSISLREFQSFISKDVDILRILSSYGLISKEDLRIDYGGNEEIPEADSDLDEEVEKCNADRDDRIERIKSGIEHSFVNEDERIQLEKELSDERTLFKEPKFWQKVAPASVKPEVRAQKNDSSAPPVNMQVHHVYGFRSYDTRNNLKMNLNKDIVYHTAAIGIVQQQSGGAQTFYQEHTDDITSIDISGNIVVSGQLGLSPLLCVWDSTTLETKVIFKGALKNGIGNVAISSDAKRVAATSLENEKLLVIYDIEKAISSKQVPQKKTGDGLVAMGRITLKAIFDLKFDKTCKTVIVACQNDILFVTFEGNQLRTTKGVWSQANPPQSCLSIGLIENNVVTGMFKGHLYLWKSMKFHSSIAAHNGPVLAIHNRETGVDRKGIITSGRDGFIVFWDLQLKLFLKIDTREFKLYSTRVTAICESTHHELLVFGTRASEIIEVNEITSKHKTVQNGHWDGELNGLATHPSHPFFYTVGEDNLLACWNIEKCSISQSTKLDFPARCMDLSSNSKYIAIGCVNGTVLIVDPKSLVVVFSLKDRDLGITCIRFSPDSEVLAVAYTKPSCEILIYDARNHFKLVSKIRGSTTPVTHIDFSADPAKKIIQCNNTGNELLFFDLFEQNKTKNPGKQIIDYKTQIHEIKWKTQSCVFGYYVQGIWPPCSKGTDVNSVDVSAQYQVLITGDDFSKIKAFRYPCTQPNASFTRYGGHASHISKVRFVLNDQYVISLGGIEKSIIQWKFQYDYETAELQKELGQLPNSLNETNQFEEEILDKGDQGGAIKPYLGQMPQSIPEAFRQIPEKRLNILPQQQLNLSHVFGFKCKTTSSQEGDARNLLKFLPNGNIVYPAAGVGVVGEGKREQSFFIKHEEEIVALAVHPRANIVATGQVATKGKSNLIDIYIWDAETKQILGHLNDFHSRAVVNLEFSPDGQMLLTVGDDVDHSLAIYDWQQSRLICNSRVDKAAMTAVLWKNNTEFLTCGLKHIKFWTLQGRNLTCKSGVGMNPFSPVTCLAVTANGQIVVSGSIDGRVMCWNGNNCAKAIMAHQKGVGSIISVTSKQGTKDNFMYSGGADGRIIKWKVENGNLTQDVNFQFDLHTIDLDSMKFDRGIISLSTDSKQDQFLIGTRSAQIYQGKIGGQIERISDSHFDGEVWGCAADPKSSKFATSGGDHTIRIWDISQKRMVVSTEHLPYDVRAIDWSSSGTMIVAGDLIGQIHLFDNHLNRIASAQTKFSKQSSQKKISNWIQDIKFSPNEKFIAFGAHGGPSTVEIFEIKEQGKDNQKTLEPFTTIIAGLTSSLTHLDWSNTNEKLVVNSEAYELKFINLMQKKDVASSTCAEEDWSSWTCTLGWFVKGIFPSADGTDVNCCVRSHNKKVIATGDDFGRINLFNFPACASKQVHHSYLGHSSHVTRVKFTGDDRYLLSTGGNDRTTLVWSTQNLATIDTRDTDIHPDVEDDFHDEDIGILKKKEAKFGSTKFGKYTESKKFLADETETATTGAGEDTELFGQEQVDQGEEFTSVKPWLGSIKEPSSYYKDPLNQSKQLPIKLELDYVHGYRAKDTHDNLRYLRSGCIVYHAAAIGIVMDTQTNTQKFFLGHNDDITALDLHPDGVLVATGQVGAKPSIFVWDSNTLLQQCVFKGSLKNGIAALAFSPKGDKLAAVAIDVNHEIGIFDITAKSKNGGVQILIEKSGPDCITSLKWKSETEFASVGVKHFKFWTCTATNIKATRGSWEKNLVSNTLLTVNVNGDDYICGAMDGSLQIFKDDKITSFKKNHEKALDSITVSNNTIFTGGRDLRIFVLDRNYIVLVRILLEEILRGPTLSPLCSEVRAITLSHDMKTMFIGTYASEIYEISTRDAKVTPTTKYGNPKPLVKGHYTPNKRQANEVWGLAISQINEDQFYTCSDDGTLRIWSIGMRKQEKVIRTNLDYSGIEIPLNASTGDLSDSVKGRSLAVNSEGMIAVGFKDGTLRTYDSNLQQQNCTKQAKEWISDLKFSPDGTTLAVGSHDNSIYVHSAGDLRQKVKPLKKHSSYITHVDFSRDGNTLHSNCGAYELLFWDVNTGKQITKGSVLFRDETWDTWTATLGWPVQGIWPEGADGTDINAVDRSNMTFSGVDSPPDNYSMLVTGSDDALVRVYRYPCTKKEAVPVVGQGHSSHITNVRFTRLDNFIISTGGGDNSILQWRVIKLK